MQSQIKLIVGLGNPGSDYANTRHNAGAWLVEALAEQQQQKLHLEKKFKANITHFKLLEHECWLLIPTTFMNLSGQAVKAFASFYKIAPQEILVAHDELDFTPGIVRLKQGGGAGGHNGLKDIIAQLPSPDFYRLRIGIGHPGNRDDVADYVLHTPSRHEHKQILDAIARALNLIPELIQGKMQHVMRELHSA